MSDPIRCRLPRLGRLSGGDVTRCPDCGQWWVSRWHGSAYYDSCYSEWRPLGWLGLHLFHHRAYKHYKAIERKDHE